MNHLERRKILTKILEDSNKIIVESSSDPNFKVWKHDTERALIKTYGKNSIEVSEFKKLNFFYNPSLSFVGTDYSKDHLRYFRRDMETIKVQLKSYIEENTIDEPNNQEITKIFISHSSKDKLIVEELVDLLETIGLNNKQIFCSTLEGYSIGLGENFLERIKNELDNNDNDRYQ